jgi:hypothetical protein
MVRKLDIGQTHTDVRGVIHQPLAVGHPRARVSHVRDITGPGSRRPAIVDVTATSDTPGVDIQTRHPARRLCRRPGRSRHHRRSRRVAARHPRRPPVTDPGTLDRMTGQATRPAAGFRPRAHGHLHPARWRDQGNRHARRRRGQYGLSTGPETTGNNRYQSGDRYTRASRPTPQSDGPSTASRTRETAVAAQYEPLSTRRAPQGFRRARATRRPSGSSSAIRIGCSCRRRRTGRRTCRCRRAGGCWPVRSCLCPCRG